MFLNPLVLFGLAAAAMPIAIHLINRRNPKPIPLSTLRFLQAALVKTRRQRRLTQILVLLCRILIIVLLALAFARPRLSYSNWLPEGPRTVIIVLDGTASLHARAFGKSNFDRARSWAMQLVQDLNDRDKVAFFIAGRTDAAPIFPAVSDHPAIFDGLRAAKAGYGSMSLAIELAVIVDRVHNEHPNDPIALHVFSDFQATNWNAQEFRRLGSRLAEDDIRLFMNRLAVPAVGNAWVADIRVVPEAILGNEDVTVEADIETDSRFSGANLLSFRIDDDEVGRHGLMLEPNAVSRQTSSITVDAVADAALISARLDDDVQPVDNVRYSVISRRRHVNVLLVKGGAAPHETLSDAFFVERALNPQRLSNPLFRCTSVLWSQITDIETSEYDSVFVCNPPPFEAEAALDLELYVRNGGTLVIYPGFRHGLRTAYSYLKSLGVLKIIPESFPTTRTIRLLHSVKSHPVERNARQVTDQLFQFPGKERLLFTRVGAAMQAFYHMDSGTPLAVNARSGRGAIWLSALPADRSWSEWPLSPLYVIFNQEVVRQSFARDARAMNIEVGEPAIIPWPGHEVHLRVSITTPDDDQSTAVLTRADQDSDYLLTGLVKLGLYRLALESTPPETRHVAVNVPQAEARLDAVEPSVITADLRPVTVYQPHDYGEQSIMLAELNYGYPLWPWLLLLAFALGTMEELFANTRSWNRRRSPGGTGNVGRRIV